MRSLPIAWIFTSATLAVGDSFEHFARRMGVEDAEELVLASPFDYSEQAVCYLPNRLPEPRERRHSDALLEAIMPVLELSGGRAFLLFTSHRALRYAAQRFGQCCVIRCSCRAKNRRRSWFGDLSSTAMPYCWERQVLGGVMCAAMRCLAW